MVKQVSETGTIKGETCAQYMYMQALHQAGLEPRYKAIQEAALGILFLATPHQGSENARYGAVLARVAQKAIHSPPPRLLRALKDNSRELERLRDDFRFQLSRYEIASFYELKPMRLMGKLVRYLRKSLDSES